MNISDMDMVALALSLGTLVIILMPGWLLTLGKAVDGVVTGVAGLGRQSWRWAGLLRDSSLMLMVQLARYFDRRPPPPRKSWPACRMR